MKIAVAIPCYNCASQLPRVLTELRDVAATHTEISAIYVIDNRSNDDTLQAAEGFKNSFPAPVRFQLFRNYENIGLGGTHKVALSLAQKENMSHLLILHGDHQASAYDIPLLIAESRRSGGITILGSRFIDLKNLSGYSLLRTWGNIALNVMYTVVTRRQVRDLGSGLNLFRLADLRPQHYQNFDNGFTFNMDMLLHLIRSKAAFSYIPIRWSTTDQISNARALNVGMKTLFKLLPWILHRKPQNRSHSETESLTFATQSAN